MRLVEFNIYGKGNANEFMEITFENADTEQVVFQISDGKIYVDTKTQLLLTELKEAISIIETGKIEINYGKTS
jgi:hypothetical protein